MGDIMIQQKNHDKEKDIYSPQAGVHHNSGLVNPHLSQF